MTFQFLFPLSVLQLYPVQPAALHCRQIFLSDEPGHAFFLHQPFLNPDQPVTDLVHLVHGVGYNDDGGTGGLDLFQLLKAFLLKGRVTHCQDLVYQQHIRVHVDGHGKGQAHIHAGGIGPHGLVNEFLEFGEAHDIPQALVHFPAGESEDGGIGIDIFPSRHVRVEAGSQFDQA